MESETTSGQGSRRAFRPRLSPEVSLTALLSSATLEHVAGPGVSSVQISGLSNDSRTVLPGDLYLALPGAAKHGASFAAAAVSAGAVAILTDDAGWELLRASGTDVVVPILVHADPRMVTGALAARVYGNHPGDGLTRLAVTGTNGKTTTSYFVTSILRSLGHGTGLIGTIEILAGDEAIPSVLTTPEASDVHSLMGRMKESGLDAVTMEVSSHAIEFQRVAGLIFDVAGFTNLTQDHLDLHGSMEEYYAVKARLFRPGMSRRGVVVLSDSWSLRMAAEAGIPVTTISVGPEAAATADWAVVEQRSRGALGTDFVLKNAEGESVSAHVGLPGGFNVANAALALVMVLESGVSVKDLQAVLDAHDPLNTDVPGRMQVISTSPNTVVDFAHNADALHLALDAVRDPEGRGRTIVVFGATGDRDALKRPIMGATAVQHADVVIITDDDPHNEDPAGIRSAVLAGAREEVTRSGKAVDIHESAPRAEAISLAVQLATPEDTILVAGRGHEVWQEVKGVNLALDDREELRRALRTHGFKTFPAND